MAHRPNMLIIMSDQHNPHVMGCAGDTVIRTPNLDRLAGSGVRFEHAYCGNPLCVPSRMTFLTSLHSSEIDIWTNYGVLGSEVPTFAHQLSVAGYETVLCGRMHFQHADHRHGFAKRLVGDVTPQWPGGTEPDMGDIPPSTGGQNRLALEVIGPGRTSYQAYDRAVTDGALAYLRERETASEQPFCMVAGYVLPHCPFICPRELFDEYHARVDMPPLLEGETHPAMALWRQVRGLDTPLSPDEIRTARAAYYGLVTMCDAMAGEIIQSLEETGLARDTAIFYLSDHGDMIGEQGMWWKNNFYEGSVAVPLIASWPGRLAEGEVVKTPVSLLDIGPTLLEIAGAPPLPVCSGQSLLSPLRGEGLPAGWHHDVFSENYGKEEEEPSRMIVRWPWKLIHFHGYNDPQLFNLEDDPHELYDRANDPACRAIVSELHARVRAGWDGDRIKRSVERKRTWFRTLSAWTQAIRPPEPDHWIEPAGCNIFPET